MFFRHVSFESWIGSFRRIFAWVLEGNQVDVVRRELLYLGGKNGIWTLFMIHIDWGCF